MDSPPFSYHFCNAYTFYTESDILSVIWHMSKNVINVNKCAAKQKVRILGCRGVGGICVVCVNTWHTEAGSVESLQTDLNKICSLLS